MSSGTGERVIGRQSTGRLGRCGRLVAARLLQLVATLTLILLFAFVVFYLLPGEPARIMLGPNATPEKVAALERSLGLDQPFPLRLARYVGDLLRGSLGTSLRFAQPVTRLIAERLELTLSLAAGGLFLALVIGAPLAFIAARRPGGLIDRTILALSRIGLAVPPFYLAILLTLAAGALFRSFGGVRYVPLSVSLTASLRSLLLPAVAVAVPRVAWVVQFLRGALVEQFEMDYVRTARGKGLSRPAILVRHLLPNALVPLITVLGLVLAELFSGALIIEQVYNLPGLGRLLVTAVEARDFPLALGIILVIASLVVLAGTLVDLINGLIDPRLAHARPGRGTVLR